MILTQLAARPSLVAVARDLAWNEDPDLESRTGESGFLAVSVAPEGLRNYFHHCSEKVVSDCNYGLKESGLGLRVCGVQKDGSAWCFGAKKVNLQS